MKTKMRTIRQLFLANAVLRNLALAGNSSELR